MHIITFCVHLVNNNKHYCNEKRNYHIYVFPNCVSHLTKKKHVTKTDACAPNADQFISLQLVCPVINVQMVCAYQTQVNVMDGMTVLMELMRLVVVRTNC